MQEEETAKPLQIVLEKMKNIKSIKRQEDNTYLVKVKTDVGIKFNIPATSQAFQMSIKVVKNREYKSPGPLTMQTFDISSPTPIEWRMTPHGPVAITTWRCGQDTIIYFKTVSSTSRSDGWCLNVTLKNATTIYSGALNIKVSTTCLFVE